MRQDKIKFLKKGVVFVVALTVIILLLNLLYINLVQHNLISYRKELLYTEDLNTFKNKEIEFAFFGSSHLSFAINPSYINNSYNFGINHGNYIETYYKLRKIVEQDNLKVDTIVLELDLHTFSERFNEPQDRFSNLEVANEMVSLRKISELREESFGSIILKRYFPFLGDGISLTESLIKKPKLTTLYFGWERHATDFSKEENRTKVAYASYNDQFNKNEPRISGTSFVYFLKLIQYAKDNDINVIFIKYPVTKEYDEVIRNENITKEDYYTKIFTYVDDKLGEEYAVLDYYDLFFNDTKYFNDDDHLNYIGAEVFSKKVSDDLRNHSFSKEANFSRAEGSLISSENKDS